MDKYGVQGQQQSSSDTLIDTYPGGEHLAEEGLLLGSFGLCGPFWAAVEGLIGNVCQLTVHVVKGWSDVPLLHSSTHSLHPLTALQTVYKHELMYRLSTSIDWFADCPPNRLICRLST